MNLVLYSHPDKLLATHLDEVRVAATIIAARHRLSDATYADLKLLVALHDLGKATTFFQDYITYRPDPQHWPGRQEDKRHTPLGAVASGVLGAMGSLDKARLIRIGTSVLGHHTRLPTRTDLDRTLIDGARLLLKQLAQLRYEGLEPPTGLHLPREGLAPHDETIFEAADAYEDAFDWLDTHFINDAVRFRLETQQLFSILLEADKAFLALSDSARERYRDRQTTALPVGTVERYLEHAPDSPVNALRSQARADALASLERHPERSLFTLTLPTGLGKTLTAAALAAELHRRAPRQIILALPFLSIVDQTARVYTELLGYPDSERLMQSHSLSERTYHDLDGGDADFFLDTWQSGIVVTTFDQLLLALLSARAKHQMRFHHLCDAIIIIDEVQAIPSTLWDIVQHALSALSTDFGSAIIAMSATQPGFMSGGLELTPDTEAVFKHFGRYQLVFRHEQELLLETFTDMLIERRSVLCQQRVLVTLNTRRSARRVYDDLVQHWRDADCPVYFLSADVTPADRLAVIGTLKADPDHPCLVVSTQVVEAGVDIDMDAVIRDFAPFDSLVQIAGRCNRNSRKPRCDVEVYTLINEQGKRYCELVYRDESGPDISLQEARRVIDNLGVLPEEEVLGVAERYFAALRHHKELGESHTRDWAYFREHLDVSRLLRGDQSRQHHFVVAERDTPQSGEADLRETLREALGIADRWERRRALRDLAPRLARVTVSVWARFGFDPTEIAYPVGPFLFVYEGFYDSQTGLQLPLGHSDDTSFL